MPHTTYKTLTAGGLDHRHTAFRLWQKAKRLGIWNPDDLDFSQDKRDWQRLSAPQQDLLLHLGSLFMAGEEAVTLDLLPLLKAVAEGGHLEEEMYLTTFLWEEAKHVDFFHRLMREVTGVQADLHHYQGDNYRRLFGEELPRAMHRLYTDTSPIAQAEASVVYNMIVEGVLAETGYYGWYTVLKQNNLMPGTVAGVELLQRDEGRHVRYGVFLLSRLIAEHGDPVWQAVQNKMMALMPTAVGTYTEAFDQLKARHGAIPFGLDPDEFADYALRQFQKRLTRIEQARHQSVDEVIYGTAMRRS